MPETIPNWLYKRASATPNRIALRTENESWTFKKLDERAQTFAKQFASIGIKKGDFTALLVENSIQTAAIIHALQYLGAVIVPLNNRLTPNELIFQLKDCQADLLFYDQSFSESVKTISKDLPELKLTTYETLTSLVPLEVPLQTEILLDDLHTIMYTSGTTGKPKGVMLTYGNHWWSAVNSSLNLGLHENDCWLCAVPLFHMSGLSILIRGVIYGSSVIIHERFEAQKVNAAIINERVTIVSVVSAMLSKMLYTLDQSYPKTFRCALLGGGPAPLPLLEVCKEKNIPVYQTYGMTETASQVVTLSSEYMLAKLGSAGKPLFTNELKIEKDKKAASPNEIGEIVVKGPTITKGYLNREGATKEAIQNGWLYTGDLGYLDEEGFLYVIDRRSDLIISGGENIYPAEIEAVLLSHPHVLEAGVTGLKDDQWGQVPIGFIVSKTNTLSEEELISYCSERLARYKVPKKIYFVKELPRNASNKLLRRELLPLLPMT
ncbi:o-succinylbenzoate--CoA ligase [Bacillus taeanensis]|uniref:2-succinylbenzoate--CoA ligase n=1 Tax=Bacillus taeanensis TaxID=273032 RepID=A0A366Y2U6_9BACI|nr:o-succinylbenzoate--CoA ligase [Bacillus taeanensis]RBW71329.1 o-succinylbenzoate--CoA ligase [Bacillus taeanensis]